MAPGFDVAGKHIGGDRSWVIAEAGSNHQGNLGTLLALITKAAEAGADAVKTQVRTNRELYTKAYFDRPYDSENAFGATYGQHREHLELSPDAHRQARDYANDLGLAYFATPFDLTALDLCFELDFPAVKLASGSITNLPLCIQAARTGLPIFLSTGASHLADVDRAVNAIRSFTDKLCILQATATYPCSWEDLDLAVIHSYSIRYAHSVIGLSSHTSGIAEAPAAYVLGARVFEKHFSISRAMRGTDHAFSLEPQGLAKYVRDLRRCEVMIGDGFKRFRLEEMEARTKMGSSAYFSRSLRAGHVIEPADLCIKSPAAFVPPYEIPRLIGAELVCDVEEEQAVTWESVCDVRSKGRVV